VHALAVADEVDEWLWTCGVRGHAVDLVLGAGDLPFDYLALLSDALDRPCVFVPSNHDLDLSGFTFRAGLCLQDGLPRPWPGPTLPSSSAPAKPEGRRLPSESGFRPVFQQGQPVQDGTGVADAHGESLLDKGVRIVRHRQGGQ
jgi:hypothetical protein